MHLRQSIKNRNDKSYGLFVIHFSLFFDDFLQSLSFEIFHYNIRSIIFLKAVIYCYNIFYISKFCQSTCLISKLFYTALKLFAFFALKYGNVNRSLASCRTFSRQIFLDSNLVTKGIIIANICHSKSAVSYSFSNYIFSLKYNSWMKLICFLRFSSFDVTAVWAYIHFIFVLLHTTKTYFFSHDIPLIFCLYFYCSYLSNDIERSTLSAISLTISNLVNTTPTNLSLNVLLLSGIMISSPT